MYELLITIQKSVGVFRDYYEFPHSPGNFFVIPGNPRCLSYAFENQALNVFQNAFLSSNAF